MYPLNMQRATPDVGFALANDEAEHQVLTDAGYVPAFISVSSATAQPALMALDRTTLMAQAEAKGMRVDKRWSDARLAEEVAKG